MSRPTTIKLEDLPPRAMRLSDAKIATLFGGCLGGCHDCADDKDCCMDFYCTEATKATCPNLSEYGPNSRAMVCLHRL